MSVTCKKRYFNWSCTSLLEAGFTAYERSRASDLEWVSEYYSWKAYMIFSYSSRFWSNTQAGFTIRYCFRSLLTCLWLPST